MFRLCIIQTYGMGLICSTQSLSTQFLSCLYDNSSPNSLCSIDLRWKRVCISMRKANVVWFSHSFNNYIDFFDHICYLKSMEMAHRLSSRFSLTWRKKGKSWLITETYSWSIKIVLKWIWRRGKWRGRWWRKRWQYWYRG